MSTQKIVRAGSFFVTPEIAIALFKLSGASISIAAGVATVTLASHLLTTGDMVTFSGVTGTGSTALNDSTWGPITVLTSSTYTFPVPTGVVSTSIGGTIVQEKLYFPAAGEWFAVLGANGVIEYDPGNLYGINGNNSGLDVTWRTAVAASTSGNFATDGYAVRFRENGTTATSRFSLVA